MDEELYQQKVKEEVIRLMRIQTDSDRAAEMIKYYHKHGIEDIRDNIIIDACQEILRIEAETFKPL
jgi:hypothetical protein